MDGYLAVVSKREIRSYEDRPIPEPELERILQAGRATGSASNRQPWRFMVVTDRDRLNRIAESVYAPENLRGCAVAVAIVTRSAGQGFDAGRVAQNMMLAAWNDGVGSCPNGVRDADGAHQALEVPEERHIATILTFGYPRRSVSPEGKDPAKILQRIDRKPLDQLAQRL